MRAIIQPLPVQVVAGDEELTWNAGALRRLVIDHGLSSGDRLSLALAKREGLTAWPVNREWKSIAAETGDKVVIL